MQGNPILRTHSALPFVAVAAGVLLAALALGLAAWSKGLTKDAARAECAARAEALGNTIARVLEQRIASLEAGARPPEVRARWTLEAGRVAAAWPEGASPPPAWLAEVARAPTQRPLALSDRGPEGPRAGTWLPSKGTLLQWDLERLRSETIPQTLRDAEAEDPRYRAELFTLERRAEFRQRAVTPLYPPLASWSVAVGYADQSALRRSLRLQTGILGVLAACLLLVLVGSVVLYTRGERRRALVARTREAFLARATHELQTPLAILRASVETLQRDAVEGADRERCLQIAIREEERVTLTIRRLLRYLRWESADLSTIVRWESAAETLDTALAELTPALEAAGIRLHVEREEVRGEVPADLLRDTLTELLTNARKHAGEGARVWVTFNASEDRARLSVRDDGPGVGEDPEAIFAPWSQGEAGAGRAGSGLGLALLREGWTLVGGAVRVEPGPEGATFVVEVPLRRG